MDVALQAPQSLSKLLGSSLAFGSLALFALNNCVSSSTGGAYTGDNQILGVNQLDVVELAVANLDGLVSGMSLYRPLTFTFFMLR